MAAIMVILLGGLLLADKGIDRGYKFRWPSAALRGFRPRGPQTDP